MAARSRPRDTLNVKTARDISPIFLLTARGHHRLHKFAAAGGPAAQLKRRNGGGRRRLLVDGHHLARDFRSAAL